jgi:aminopeptidase N
VQKRIYQPISAYFFTCYFNLYLFNRNLFITTKNLRNKIHRGSITPERAWWNVEYDLAVTPNFKNFFISGSNTISFKLVKRKEPRMQIDLQDPLIIDSAILNGVPVNFTRDGHAWYIEMPKRKMPKSLTDDKDLHQLYLVYHGVPKPALRAPWDGGVVWKKDKNGNPWINVACQGLGASVWWPCKDHQSDEPDSGVSISITALIR